MWRVYRAEVFGTVTRSIIDRRVRLKSTASYLASWKPDVHLAGRQWLNDENVSFDQFVDSTEAIMKQDISYQLIISMQSTYTRYYWTSRRLVHYYQ